jgi:hypothetical protein
MSRLSYRASRFLPVAAAAAIMALAGAARAQGAPATDSTANVSPEAPPAPAPAPADTAAVPAAPEAPPAPAEAPPPAAPPVTASSDAEDAAEKAGWEQRDSLLNESNTLTGGVGLLRTQHAQSGAPGQFRIGFVGEWFSAGFLCTTQFPCPKGGALLTSDTLDHTGGTLSLGGSLFKIGEGTFEAYLSTASVRSTSGASRRGCPSGSASTSFTRSTTRAT